jgi:hypothetical protein
MAPLLLFLCAAGAAAQADLSVPLYPELNLENPDPDNIDEATIEQVEDLFNEEFARVVDAAIEAANTEIGDYGELSQLARGFGDAAVFTGHAASQRSYPDYRRFYVNLGSSLAVQLPARNPEGFEALREKIRTSGDVYVGAAWQPWAISVGTKLSVISDKLYVGGSFGYLDNTITVEGTEIALSAQSVGLFGHYRVVDGFWRNGPIRWRGVGVGSGLLWHGTGLSLDFTGLGSFTEAMESGAELLPSEFNDALEATDSGYDPTAPLGSLTVSPTLQLGTETREFTIPLELSTGVRLLYLLDISVGAGVDLNFGRSTAAFEATGTAEAGGYVQDSTYMSISPGTVALSSSTTSSPSFAKPRINTAVSLNMGPVKLTVPLAYHFGSGAAGLSGGINLGLLW